ncbi:zinc finger matrin-type protein 1 isoform X4 [Salmo salar]|nr:zinc finger matrin-type protein 1 isoform X4 [Salmo salar]
MLKERSLFPADLGESDLKGLFTDSHCHVCEASLLFESQRIAHYEGKKHAQKVRLYVQTKKDEKRSKDFQRGITMDKDRFCELCSMVFSSPVVARSHYDGKVHAKNLRKQALYPTTQPADILSQRGPGLAIAGPLQASGIDQGMVEEGGKGPQNTSETVDLSDPNKHCRLCAASFNNPHMAQQHYAGRKHQRNHSRQQLLKDLGEDPAQANSFTCPVCNIKLDSVEMYHAHMQGNKHQIKEKKVVDLCKSQKKVYDSFADELADYIHVQKARGIAPKTSFGATGEEEEGEGEANLGKVDGQNKTTLVLPPSSRPPLPLTSLPLHPAAAFYPPPLWCPPYQPPPTHFGFKGGTYEQTAWGHAFPQGFLPGSAPAGFIGWPKARGRGKECSSSSSSYTSSSSCSSDSSDSSDSDYRHRERKRRKRKMRKERGRRAREEDSEERKRRRGKSLRDDDTEGRRGREHDEEAEEESKRKRKRLHYSSRSHREGHRAKKRREEDEDKEGRKEEKEESTEERVGGGEEKEVHIQAEIQEEMEEREQAKETKAKHRKDKKKTKEKVDTRTEEEKLWDESIIGL